MPPVTASRAEGFSIGELSRATRVNIETIRYYERIGILPRARRTSGGRRLYGAEEARALAFVRRARELGFTLDDVRVLLALGGPQKGSCKQVEEIAAHHLGDIRTKIADLRRLERVLASTIAECAEDTSITLADLLTPLLRADPSLAVWALLRRRSKEKIDDGVAYGWQAWLRRRSGDSFFSASLV